MRTGVEVYGSDKVGESAEAAAVPDPFSVLPEYVARAEVGDDT